MKRLDQIPEIGNFEPGVDIQEIPDVGTENPHSDAVRKSVLDRLRNGDPDLERESEIGNTDKIDQIVN